MKVRAWILVMVAFWGNANIAVAQESSHRNQNVVAASDARAFAVRLQRAVANGDRGAVAELFRYPMRVPVPGLIYPVFVSNRSALLRLYDAFFTPLMRCAITDSRVPTLGDPKPRYPLLASTGVLSLAGGRIVAERSDGNYRITRMSVFGDAPVKSGSRRQVALRWDQGEEQFAGRIGHEGVDIYIIAARRGDLLKAQIEDFPGRAISMQMVEGGSGKVVHGAATEYARTWIAPLKEAGEYHLKVIRHGSPCDPAVTYLLTLRLTR
jgi:hypothetical protein